MSTVSGGRAEARLLTPEERLEQEHQLVAAKPGNWELTQSRTASDPRWVARRILVERDEEGEYEVRQYESTDLYFGRLLRRIDVRNQENKEAGRG